MAIRRRELFAGLTGAAILGSATAAHGAVATPPLVWLNRSLAGARWAFERCRYAELADRLPVLIDAARIGRDATTGHTRDQCAVVLSNAYVLASELAVKLNDNDNARAAADRALAAARDGGDPIAIAAALRAIGIAMRRQGRYAAATHLLTGSALSLGAGTGNPPANLLAAYGAVLCTAAYSSAQHGRPAQAMDLIEEAHSAAVRMGDARGVRTVFSRTNVAVYRIGIHTALGDPAAALDCARRVARHLLPTPERHARFCVDAARAWERYGRRDRAYEALRLAEWHAPEELRRPSVRSLIADLLAAPVRPAAGLRALASRCGVAG